MDNSAYSLRQQLKQTLMQAHLQLQAIRNWLVNFLNLISIFLTYEIRKSSNDHQLISIIKIISNCFLFYIPFPLRLMQRFWSENPYYPFIDEIVQTTTRVIFTRSQRSGEPICLKLWRRTKSEVCDERLIVRSDVFLIEGLAFNRQFAPDVYLGVATIIIDDDKKRIQRGRLVKQPDPEKLISDKRYALVMKTLRQEQRLDHLLENGKVDMQFLAREVAKMHRLLKQSTESEKYGRPDHIAAKLNLNNDLFLDAMNDLFSTRYIKFKWIGDCLKEACHILTPLFESRYTEGHIKRCHGDLKVTNLWVKYLAPYFLPRLLALDCIDFKPEFCFIDTLSDVAMLAVDLERLDLPEVNPKEFLLSYLSEMEEEFESIEPLLEYYLTEKAIVCCYVSILFDDHQQDLGKKYLRIASNHARRLQMILEETKLPRIKQPVYSS